MKKRKLFISALLVASFLSLAACSALRGPIGPQGQQGEPGIRGSAGKDGQDGKDGVSIVSIEKISSDGLEDKYKINYSDESSSYFVVKNGADGEQGIQGLPGENGHSPVITIGENGNWFVDGVDTGVKAQGPKGDQGPKGETGDQGVSVVSIIKTGSEGLVDTYTITYSDGTTSTFTVTNGAQGAQGIQGNPGQNGHTPVITIGSNGNWFVDGADTNIKAQGPKGDTGAQGVSVVSIVKTSTDGLVDTYTITYSNGSTSTFTVTNGAQGIQGIQGNPGADGSTPVITIGENGNWFINDVDSGIKAQGPQGETGPQGPQGVSVVSTEINEDGDLIITFSDGTTQNAGHVKDVNVYTVNFYIGEEIVATRTVPAYSKVARPTEEEIAGYRVDYWYTKDGDYQDVWNFQGCVITENTDIYAHYEARDYVISFSDTTFGNVVADYHRSYNQDYSLPTLSQTGYTFLGWYDSDNVKMNNTGIFRIPHDVSLIARWSANTYSVTFAPAGGRINGSTANITRNYTYGTRYALPTPEREGFFFEGWLNGTDVIPQSVVWSITSNVTLVANWSSTKTYTFNAGAGSVSIANQTISYGESYTLPSPTLPENKKFDGWYIGAVNEGKYVPLTGTWSYTGTESTLVAHYFDSKLSFSEYSDSCTVKSSASSDWAFKTVVVPGYLHGKPTECGSTFYSQYGLTYVEIEEGCRELSSTFKSCFNLTRIILPSTLQTITHSVSWLTFGGCYKLATIVNKSPLSFTIGSTDYDSIALYAKEIVSSVSQSKLSTDSNSFVHYKSGAEDIIINWTGTIVNDENGRFHKTIPYGVTQIEHDAFYYCGNSNKGPFDEVTIPYTVKRIGKDAFSYSDYLDTINYQGTMSQWNQINLETDWCRNCKKTITVHCTNGDIVL